MDWSWTIIAAVLFGWGIFRIIKNKNKNTPQNDVNTGNANSTSGGINREFCSKCGQKLEPNAKFCRMCGTRL